MAGRRLGDSDVKIYAVVYGHPGGVSGDGAAVLLVSLSIEAAQGGRVAIAATFGACGWTNLVLLGTAKVVCGATPVSANDVHLPVGLARELRAPQRPKTGTPRPG